MTEAKSPAGAVRDILPGLVLSAAVAAAAFFLSPYTAAVVPVPAMVLALIIGIALNPLAVRPVHWPGMAFSVHTILRWAVALLGLRIALADIVDLGIITPLVIVAAMAVTLASGFVFARIAGQPAGFGALAGAATAVCGASATLATSTVVPDYPNKQADVVFVVIAVNALATLAMVAYPPLCLLLGFDPLATGVMLGGTIHDVAQVVGAGYSVSEFAGNSAVIVKLFRVFLLLPVVLGIGWYLARIGPAAGPARVPLPGFAIAFLVLCLLNSAMQFYPEVLSYYLPLKAALVQLSTWGLLIAIGALGLETSVTTVAALGWRHAATIVGTSAVIFALVTGSLLLLP